MKIGLTFTPSHFVEKEVMKLTKVRITYGGGMGGANQVVYTNDKFDLNEKFIEIKTIDKRLLKVNTNFICMVETVNVAHFIIENDGHPYVKDRYNEYWVDTGTQIPTYVDNDYVNLDKDKVIRTLTYNIK